jgi:hypothetical protein
MRRIFGAPIFLRLGARMRGPAATPVGRLHGVIIADVVAEGVQGGQAILILGLAGHPVEDVTLADIRIEFEGGGAAAEAGRVVPEMERDYPEPGSFGITPSWGLYARHAGRLAVHHVVLGTRAADGRPSVTLEDVRGAEFEQASMPPSPGAKTFDLREVEDFRAQSCRGVPDTARAKSLPGEQL